ncbi:MAG: ATP-binding protein [Victivallaceae bacterium]
MKELVIVSGKGGTGKTSITAALAALAGNAVLADCDVDAADLHLLLHPEKIASHQFISGHEAIIDPEKCRNCGECMRLCRFKAITVKNNNFMVDPYACEGCGVCVRFCPAQAIDFFESLCGEWYESKTSFGVMFHAKLAPAAENSGKLVSQVRQAARETAEKQGSKLILVDGPPGIGCPVIASLTGASAVLIVAEPTVSGEHDMKRVLSLAGHFKIPAMVCVNKWDLNPEVTENIEQIGLKSGARVVGRVPYDTIFTEAMVNGRLVIDYPETSGAESVIKIWENICQVM